MMQAWADYLDSLIGESAPMQVNTEAESKTN
jgi:hypothetical protein